MNHFPECKRKNYQMSNDPKYARACMVKWKIIYAHQSFLILCTLYLYNRFETELVEQSGDIRNSLWSDSASWLWQIREPSPTQGLKQGHKAEVGLSGSSRAPEPRESIRFVTHNGKKQMYQISQMCQTYIIPEMTKCPSPHLVIIMV